MLSRIAIHTAYHTHAPSSPTNTRPLFCSTSRSTYQQAHRSPHLPSSSLTPLSPLLTSGDRQCMQRSLQTSGMHGNAREISVILNKPTGIRGNALQRALRIHCSRQLGGWREGYVGWLRFLLQRLRIKLFSLELELGAAGPPAADTPTVDNAKWKVLYGDSARTMRYEHEKLLAQSYRSP